MSDEKKSFFASLEPKSALIVGLVAGVLVICSVGFVVMLGLYFSKSGGSVVDKSDAPTADVANNAGNTPVAQAPKSDKPVVELFVMSYCPYGLQMQKAFTPVMKLLGAKADMSIKYVSYAMHGQKEIEENTRQYCIQNEQSAKFIAYLDCFSISSDSVSCLKSAGVNEGKMNTCVEKTNKQFKTMDLFNDQSTWLSGRYPQYPVQASLNEKYGVQGSPTMVINGAQVESNRSAEAIKTVVCDAFNNKPAECSQVLSTVSASAGFGAGTGADTAGVECES